MNRYRIQRPAFSENALCFATFLFMICALAAGCAQETNQDESVPVKRLVDEVHTFTRLFPAAAHLNRLTEKGAEVTGTWGIIPEAPQVYFTDYLVIGPTELIEAIDDLIVYRARQGYRVRRGLLENILEDYPADSVPESVRAYLQDHVQSPGNTLALLVGSHATIPMVWFETDSSSGAEWSYDLYTDGFYADLHSDFDSDGDGIYGEWGQDDYDLTKDLHLGRVPLDDPEELTAWTQRVLSFEQEKSWRMSQALLAGGYISMVGDTAIAVSMVRDWVLAPNNFEVFTMLEEHNLPYPLAFLQYDRILDQPNFTDQMTIADYGFAFWMSHGSSDGAYTLDHGVFIHTSDLDHLNTRPPMEYFSSACSQADPEDDTNLAHELVKRNGVSFVGSTTVTHPGDLGEGALIFVVAMQQAMVNHLPLARAMDEARDTYIDLFWFLPYDRGQFLINYFGFTVFGDPALVYPQISE